MRKLSFTAALVAVAVLVAAFIVPASSKTAGPSTSAAGTLNTLQDIPVRGTTSDGNIFRGRLDVNRFFVNDLGELRGRGILNGRVIDNSGDVVKRVNDETVRFPVAVLQDTTKQPAQDCPILHLELGPIDLDLLGLVIHVDKVVVDITAEPGPGNLLGNLLCAIAHLLDDPPGNLNTILANLLNAIRDLLRFLG